MEETYRSLASEIVSRAANSKNHRYLVAIAGPPGSGKSTLATEVCKLINSNNVHSSAPINDDDSVHAEVAKSNAVAVSMDGFHLTRAHLDTLPNSKEAYIRRGAPWTFDVKSLVDFVHRLRVLADSSSNPSTASTEPLYVPSFDHAVKDPIPNGISIAPTSTIVILEGLYLLLDEQYWNDIAGLMDFKIFVNVDEEVARMRVAKRHVLAGIEENLQDGLKRVDKNDTLNGRLIRERCVRHDVGVVSLEG